VKEECSSLIVMIFIIAHCFCAIMAGPLVIACSGTKKSHINTR